jgi:hypothetical protein
MIKTVTMVMMSTESSDALSPSCGILHMLVPLYFDDDTI